MTQSVIVQKSPVVDEGKEWPQILMIFSASLAVLTNGITIAWLSPSIPILLNDKENYDISVEEVSNLAMIGPIALMVASPVCGWLSNIVGRKPVLLFQVVLQTAFWLLVGFAQSIWLFYLSRVVSGFALACTSVCCSMYIGEISSPKVRGTWGNLISISVSFGQLLASVIGGHMSIRNTSFVCLIIVVLFATTFIGAPESPYFYVMKGRDEDARISLRMLHRKENVDVELQKIRDAVQRQLSESKTSWRELLRVKSNRKALYVGIFLRMSQRFSGWPAFVVYNQYMFELAGGSLSPNDSATIFFAVAAIMNICGGYLLDIMGRRLAMLLSLVFCSLTLYLQATYFYISDNVPAIDVSTLNWLPLFILILFVISFEIGLETVPYIMMGELFSQNFKSKALSVQTIVSAVFASISAKVFQILQTTYGLYSVFVFFGTICLINTFASYYVVPETKGKTLDEIQQDLKTKN